MVDLKKVNTGSQPNDGTGWSLKKSFDAINENFDTLATFFENAEAFSYVTLQDTDNELKPLHIPLVNQQGSELNLVELASDSSLPEGDKDTIRFSYSVDGKLVVTSAFTRISDDTKPIIGGPLNAAGKGIGNISVTPEAAIEFNNAYNTNISVNDLAISKGYADQRYITSGLPFRTASEPETTNQYTLQIQSYTNGNINVPNHGFDRAANGTGYTFNTVFDDPSGITSGNIYYIRVVSKDELSLFTDREDAIVVDNTVAENRKEFVSGIIADDDTHKIVDRGYDPDLAGNYLADVALPRKSAVRRQGDTMDGDLVLNDHPGDLAGFGIVNGSDDLLAASKLYVDNTSFSSTENLFVSTSGDDKMSGVPKGKDGTSFNFAFRTIGAAAQKADELIRASEPEPGPYMQLVTTNGNRLPSTVVSRGIVNPQNQKTSEIIKNNKNYLLEEYVSFLKFEFPDFVFDETMWLADAEKIIDAVRFDVSRGINANILTRQSAQYLYGTVDGRFKIQNDLQQFKSSINFIQNTLNDLLENKLYFQSSVKFVTVNGERATVETFEDHGLKTGNQVFFRNMKGMIEIENQTAYIRKSSNKTFELYEDAELTKLFDISSYTNYTVDGKIGVVYQPRIATYKSISEKPQFLGYDAEVVGRNAVRSLLDLFKLIVENGIDAGVTEIYGNNYLLSLDNDAQEYLDQAKPTNLDMIPGKIIVGKSSGAKGRIVKVTNNDNQQTNADTFELIQLNGVDFILGEEVEYGNFVKEKQITINIETGVYKEDFPIKIPDNVSLKGDEFRRVLIRPKKRVSQSKWADVYFYRDRYFDGNELLKRQHGTITSAGILGNNKLKVDNTDFIELNDVVYFVSNNSLFTPELDKGVAYLVTNVNASDSTITIATDNESPDITFASAQGKMHVVKEGVAPFLNQVNELQGYIGRHYLVNPYKNKRIYNKSFPNNVGDYSEAAHLLTQNKNLIVNEILEFVNQKINSTNPSAIWSGFSYNSDDWVSKFSEIIQSVVYDLVNGGTEKTLETQGNIFNQTNINNYEQIKVALGEIKRVSTELLLGTFVSQVSVSENKFIFEENNVIDGASLVENLIDIIEFGLSENYNPPKLNTSDGLDVFLMGDATIARNITVQSHGGFMCVLDPESQVLTKSPYIQSGSSFSKSENEKRFRGGLFVDAFTGNIPVKITSVINPYELEVASDIGQGLFERRPLLPAPFYIDGERYQINAISNYDSNQGTVKLFLDKNSNTDSNGVGQGYIGPNSREIFIQTAGNRSMLGNDFTQINDYGYGLVTNNGAFSEMVSMFTYFCQAAYYAKNGSEIRSLNGSNGYGKFGLVAEGSDPNEIPDNVTLANSMTMPCKTFSNANFKNNLEQPFIYLYDFQYTPLPDSFITIDHGDSIGVLTYKISSISNLTVRENLTASDYVHSGTVYELGLRGDVAQSGNLFGELQDDILADTYVEFRYSQTFMFDNVRSVSSLLSKPSTALNFDESTEITYRTLSYTDKTEYGQSLDIDQISTKIDTPYEIIKIIVDTQNLSSGFGNTAGDSKIAIDKITDNDDIIRITRDLEGRQPGDPEYSGGMVVSYAGKTHQIVNYVEDVTFAYIEIEDVVGTNIDTSSSISGINRAIPATRSRNLFAGLKQNSKAEITLGISLTRATGHDFTQIGTGGFNESNYPNVIFGSPENSYAPAYSDSPSATSAQIWERRKGRVFFVTSDQDGIFRIGKFFSVDQATGSIEFSGSVGLSAANSLGFIKGVTINEFSTDDSFSDLSTESVPTERTIADYINRVLGFNPRSNSQIIDEPSGNRIGSGFVALNGITPLEGNLDLNNNYITNLGPPGTDGTAATNKNYVDSIGSSSKNLSTLRNSFINNDTSDSFFVGTGKHRLFVNSVMNGSLNTGDIIENSGGANSGVVLTVESGNDLIDGTYNTIVYEQSAGEFSAGQTVFKQGTTVQATVIDDPVPEFANTQENTNSMINFSVTRDISKTTHDLQLKSNVLNNIHVNSDAGILQSKLNLKKAETFIETDPATGWDNVNKSQSDLGLSTFSDKNFEIDQGYVRIAPNGIDFAEIPQISQNQAFARTNTGTGNVQAVDFAKIVEAGAGLQDSDFQTSVSNTDLGYPGDVLVKLEQGVYGITSIAFDSSSNTIAQRTSDSKLDANGLLLSGSNFATLTSGTTVNLDTPGGARILKASGNSTSSLVTIFPGNVDVGETARNTQSVFQNDSTFASQGWLSSDWIYTNFIEANQEGGSNSTGIGFGSGTNFPESSKGIIDLIAGGSECVVISDLSTTVKNNLDIKSDLSIDENTTLGSSASNTISFNAQANTSLIPATTQAFNLGTSGQRWDVVYANILNGTATKAKYADLAENYISDSEYESGTVVVFGGKEEITVTAKKGDRKIAGVVSANPAYLMNSELSTTSDQPVVSVALQGRVFCKVLGKVEKGDMLVASAIPGFAVVDNNPGIGTVLGKSLQDKTDASKGTIEIVVGKTKSIIYRSPLIIDHSDNTIKELSKKDALKTDCIDTEKLTVKGCELSSVALSNSYHSLDDTPKGFSGDYNDLKNKPKIAFRVTDLLDVSSENYVNKSILQWDSKLDSFVATTLENTASNIKLDMLSDVDSIKIKKNNYLKYTGYTWQTTPIVYTDIKYRPKNLSDLRDDIGFLSKSELSNELKYTPTNNTHWSDPAPESVWEALDRIAACLADQSLKP